MFAHIATYGRLHTEIYDNYYYLNCLIITFPILSSNILSTQIVWCIHISVDTLCPYMFTLYGLHIQECAPNAENAPTQL